MCVCNVSPFSLSLIPVLCPCPIGIGTRTSITLTICIYNHTHTHTHTHRYKTPDAKPLNRYGFDERPLTSLQAKAVIEETHVHWKKLAVQRLTPKDTLWVG